MILHDGKPDLMARFREIGRYRGLLYFFILRDYKVRYKQTFAGVLWIILKPLITLSAFVALFGRFKEISSNGVPYVIFVFSGLVLWFFFSNIVMLTSTSLVQNTTLITKVYFPRIIIPLAVICGQVIDLAITLVLFIITLIWFGYFSLSQFLLSLPLLFLTCLLASGVGFFLSAMNVKYRDVGHTLPFFMQILLFLSPIIYPAPSGRLATLTLFNPLTGIIESFRSILFSTPFPTQNFIVGIAITLCIFAGGTWYFLTSEKYFSDII